MNARQELGPSERRPVPNRVPLLDITALPPLKTDQERFLQRALQLRGDDGIDPSALMRSYVGEKYIQEGSGKSRMRSATMGLNRTLLSQEYAPTPGRYVQLEDVGDKEHPALDFVHVSKAELEARTAKAAGKIPPLITPPTEYFDPFDHDSVSYVTHGHRTDLPEPIHDKAGFVLAEVDYLRREEKAVRKDGVPTPLFRIQRETSVTLADKIRARFLTAQGTVRTDITPLMLQNFVSQEGVGEEDVVIALAQLKHNPSENKPSGTTVDPTPRSHEASRQDSVETPIASGLKTDSDGRIPIVLDKSLRSYGHTSNQGSQPLLTIPGMDAEQEQAFMRRKAAELEARRKDSILQRLKTELPKTPITAILAYLVRSSNQEHMPKKFSLNPREILEGAAGDDFSIVMNGIEPADIDTVARQMLMVAFSEAWDRAATNTPLSIREQETIGELGKLVKSGAQKEHVLKLLEKHLTTGPSKLVKQIYVPTMIYPQSTLKSDL